MGITSVARSVRTASSCVAATCATCSRTESHTAASPETTVTPKTARCSLSCSATSAIDTPKRARTRSRNFSTTRRLSFSDRACGTWNVRRRTPTNTSSSQLLLDLLDLVALDDILLLELVVALETDAALEALDHLARVVLEALEAGNLPVPNHGAVAHEASLRAAHALPRRDVATGDGRALHLEDDADLGLAVLLL